MRIVIPTIDEVIRAEQGLRNAVRLIDETFGTGDELQGHAAMRSKEEPA
jgi:hypothetical protein